ncbi:MAG: HAD-IIB family hydrolase [Cyanobacteria bacterium P01_F01_bin.42]
MILFFFVFSSLSLVYITAGSLFSLTQAQDWMPSVRLIATDMDGTLTRSGKFHSQLLRRLEQLRRCRIPVMIVTGRSAGWVSALVEYLPVAGAIAENGGYLFTPETPAGQPLIELDPDLRLNLEQTFTALQSKYPTLEPSADNPFRVTDWTFDRKDLSMQALNAIAADCDAQGWGFTYSSIQCHIKPRQQSKQLGLLGVLGRYFHGAITPDQVLTIGDSPNDAELLDAAVFPHSVGVANIEPYLNTMPSQPQWISNQAELAGFLEITSALVNQEENGENPYSD